MKTILIIGATSAMAEAVARLYAGKGDALFLVARDETRLEAVAEDLRIRGAAEVVTHVWDALDRAGIPSLLAAVEEAAPRLDVVLVGYGVLPDQETCQASAEAARTAIDVNFTSVVEIVTPLAARLEAQGHGTLAVLSSVAGDRGRQSNYVYGAAKAGLSTFLAGLRNRLFRSGVSVVTIKPGFVDSPMTAHIEGRGLLWSTPKRVAPAIRRAVARGKHVAYVPWFWRPIMFCIRSIPELVFKRMRL